MHNIIYWAYYPVEYKELVPKPTKPMIWFQFDALNLNKTTLTINYSEPHVTGSLCYKTKRVFCCSLLLFLYVERFSIFNFQPLNKNGGCTVFLCVFYLFVLSYLYTILNLCTKSDLLFSRVKVYCSQNYKITKTS